MNGGKIRGWVVGGCHGAYSIKMPGGKLANFTRRSDGGFQQTLHYFEVDHFRLRIADASFAQTDTFYFQQLFMRVHHIHSQNVKADEMFLAGKTNLDYTIR